LHDWPDAEAIVLLGVVASAMRGSMANPSLVILDMVCSDRLGHEPWKLDFSDFFDLNMLVTVRSKLAASMKFEKNASFNQRRKDDSDITLILNVHVCLPCPCPYGFSE